MTQYLFTNKISLKDNFISSNQKQVCFIITSKKILFALVGILVSFVLNAQISKSLNVTPGSLFSALTTTELETITKLTLTGSIDARDFKTMRDGMPILSEIDMEGTTIAAFSGLGGTYNCSNDPTVSCGTFYRENTIPQSAFSKSQSKENTTLTSIILPQSIKTIGKFSFKYCTKLISIKIPASVTTIGDDAFLGCTNLASVELPTELYEIRYNAFEGCSELNTIEIPSSVFRIWDGAFKDCSKLTKISMSSNLNSISKSTFMNCSALISLEINASIQSISPGAFFGCSALINVDSNNKFYSSLDGVLYDKNQTKLIFCPSSKSGDFIIPSSVTTIAEYAFQGCTKLMAIAIPSSVVSIEFVYDPFSDCTGLITIDANNPVYSSLDGVIYNKAQTLLIYCPVSKMGIFSIPTSVTSIGDAAFNGCYKLTTIAIPPTVSSIGNSPFFGCEKLNSIIALNPIPINFLSTSYVFEGINMATCTLNVPDGSKSAYQVAPKWKDFLNIVELVPTIVANAGQDQVVNEGMLVTLNGTGSSNTNNTALLYQWTAPAGITLSSETASNPTFAAPEVATDTNYTFSLTVNDGSVKSAPDMVIITVKQVNKAPIANAGADQTINEGSSVILDGSASTDPDNDELTYYWTGPVGIILSSETTSNPTFTAPKVATDTNYIFTLAVNDGSVYSTPDTVTITLKHVNKAPVANAGADQTINEGSSVILDGSASTDPDNDALTYNWTAPEGITLSSKTAKNPTFTAPEVSQDVIYTFILVVNDGKTDSDTSQVSITVKEVLPVLKLVSKTSESSIPSNEVTYQIYLKKENLFTKESIAPVSNGDTTLFTVEPGEWIVLASPAKNSSTFISTYIGNTLNWINAEHIIIQEKTSIFKEITCFTPEIANIGTGEISGYIYMRISIME